MKWIQSQSSEELLYPSLVICCETFLTSSKAWSVPGRHQLGISVSRTQIRWARDGFRADANRIQSHRVIGRVSDGVANFRKFWLCLGPPLSFLYQSSVSFFLVGVSFVLNEKKINGAKIVERGG